MVSGAKAVLRTGIGLEAGAEAFMLTAINVAMEESANVQAVAARKLGVSQSFISRVEKGKTLTRFSKRGKYNKTEQK
jgi:transcriptional regulator with XRE-family HTH domain